MEALMAAAQVAGTTSGSTDKAGEEPWTFPVFVGHRRRLAPDDELFETGNIEREQLARQAAVQMARDERRQLSREAQLAADAELADHRFECVQCHAALPTARLLGIHVSEMHDSYFAAQAARRMPVYLCLVEGCHRKFCTVEERKQHLRDHHQFPRHFQFDRMHLRRHKAQIRPLPQYRKGHGRQAMAAEPSGGDGGGSGSAAAAGAAPGGEAVAAGAAAAAAAGEQQRQQGGAPSEAVQGQAGHADEVVHGMSRLSMAAEHSRVPNVVSFGRGRGRGLAGVPRGRGGQKAHAKPMVGQ